MAVLRAGSHTRRSRREEVVRAALTILCDRGPTGLSQAKIAGACGIRQSHLTYYFPKRVHLLQAILEAYAASWDEICGPAVEPALRRLVIEPQESRLFVSMIVLADEMTALRSLGAKATSVVERVVAVHYGREQDDPDVEAFVDGLLGGALRNLVRARSVELDVAAYARRFGLVRTRRRK